MRKVGSWFCLLELGNWPLGFAWLFELILRTVTKSWSGRDCGKSVKSVEKRLADRVREH